MITPKIKNLFQFVEFLHSNIENFKRNDAVMSELHSLREELIKLSPGMNFKEKLKLREVQAEIKDKFQVIQENIIQPIQAKANKLNICDPKNTDSLWNWNISEIHDLKENFSKEDLPEIFSHNKKYIEYRTKTKGEAFFGLVSFFIDLDKLLKKLFGFFTETTENEFKAFEIKTIKLNTIRDVAEINHPKYKSLAEAFNSIADYNSVMNDLKDKNYISDNGTWQDRKAAYKLALASMIKWLAANGYCKKVNFTWQEIHSFCINDFKIESIGRSTIIDADPIKLNNSTIPPKI